MASYTLLVTCLAAIVVILDGANALTTPKPGFCGRPVSTPKCNFGFTTHPPLCSDDSSCTGARKCCTNGCYLQCFEPKKQGTCPAESLVTAACSSPGSCRYDNDCRDNLKCCFNIKCERSICMAPVTNG